MNFKNITLALSAGLVMLTGFASCSDQPDAYEIADGTPTINYIRLADYASRDSLIEGAYMETPIAIIGSNLRSITQIYFNDQKATLNTSYITDNALLVSVPKNMPDVVTNKMYITTSSGQTIERDFKVLVNAPSVTSMSNEYAKAGETATIYGDYFFTYDDAPLTITLPGNVEVPAENITSVTKNAVSFIMPEVTEKGYATVTTTYGKGRSKFYMNDDRYILFDWDGTHGNALAIGHGWRNGNVGTWVDGVEPLDGNYLIFKGNLSGAAGDSWEEDGFSFNYWPDPDNGYPELSSLYDISDPENYNLKFEINVPQAWSACALQVIFTGNSQVTYNTASNSYIGDDTYPRALWTPWYDSTSGAGEYTTDGWVTVTIPLSELTRGPAGEMLSANTSNFTGLTFFVYKGAYDGTDCSPIICIDNIRLAPIEK